MQGLAGILDAGLPGPHAPGLYPGAVAAVAARGSLATAAVGEAVRYADGAGTLLPADERRAMGPDTVFDIASVTKVFTAVVVLGLVEEGRLDLDVPVARWLPEFGDGDRRNVTLRQLLTHTSGLPASSRSAAGAPDPESCWARILAIPLTRPPGTGFRYSDVGFLVAGRVAERGAGRSLDRLVTDRITRRLGLADTGYSPRSPVERFAATEYLDGRGMVCGVVHDRTAHVLGGVAGHAGLFSTAADLVRFGEALRGGHGLLREDTLAEFAADHLAADLYDHFGHGLGVRIGDACFMGPLDTAFGHVGFTGTSLVVDPVRELTIVLLTNRVHPNRTWCETVNPIRQALAERAAAAVLTDT